MGDHDVIRERLRLLAEYTSDLSELQGVEFAEYEDNKLIRRFVERTLHLAVEACLDIGQQIVALEGLRTPEDNKDIFVVLAETGLIPDALLPNLIAMAKFRNVIVHDYVSVDDSVVVGILKRHLGDFDAFAQAVAEYIETD